MNQRRFALLSAIAWLAVGLFVSAPEFWFFLGASVFWLGINTVVAALEDR